MTFQQELDRLVSDFKPHFCRPNQSRVMRLAERHLDFWRWVFALRPGRAAPAFVSIWPRGGGKSTSVELAVAHVARKQTRRYGLYVSETQKQADMHVSNAGRMLEETGVQRSVTKYGHARSWRRNRSQTMNDPPFQTIQTLRYGFINRAGLLVQPGGRQILNVGDNPMVRKRFETHQSALAA